MIPSFASNFAKAPLDLRKVTGDEKATEGYRILIYHAYRGLLRSPEYPVAHPFGSEDPQGLNDWVTGVKGNETISAEPTHLVKNPPRYRALQGAVGFII